MKYYIGIDLGGTNIVAGVVNEAYEILAKASVKTNLPRPEQEIAADMAKVAKEAAEKAGLTTGYCKQRNWYHRIFQQSGLCQHSDGKVYGRCPRQEGIH